MEDLIARRLITDSIRIVEHQVEYDTRALPRDMVGLAAGRLVSALITRQSNETAGPSAAAPPVRHVRFPHVSGPVGEITAIATAVLATFAIITAIVAYMASAGRPRKSASSSSR